MEGTSKVRTPVKGGCQSLIGVLCPLSGPLTRPHHLYLLHSLFISVVLFPHSLIHLERRSPRASWMTLATKLNDQIGLDHRRVFESQDQLDKPHAAVAAVRLEPARTPLIIRHGRTRNPICAKCKACMTSTQISNQAIKEFWGLYRNDVVI